MPRSQRKSSRFENSIVPQFPALVEILDLVLGYLDGNKQTLSACSLTCRSWHLLARRHLFATVRIRDGKRYLALHRVLKSEPSLAQLVRILEIDANSPPDSWAKVPHTLTKLPSVHNLTIRRWAAVDIPTTFRAKLSTHCAHLRSLTLHDVAMPRGDFLRMLFNCPLLRHLSAKEVGLMDDMKGSAFELPKRSTLVALDTLELHDDTSDVLVLLVSTPVEFHPARVILQAAPDNVQCLSPALKKCDTGLRELVVTFDGRAKEDYLTGLSQYFSFASNRTLEFLHVKNSIAHVCDSGVATFRSDMAVLAWTLARLRAENTHLTRIVVTDRFPTKAQRSAFARNSSGWAAMDRMLAETAQARPLSLHFQFVHSGLQNQQTVQQLTRYFDKVVEMLRAKLPLFAETGARWGVVCGLSLGKGAVFGGTVMGRRWERWYNLDEKLYFESMKTSRELAAKNWKVAISGQWPGPTSSENPTVSTHS